MIKIILFVLLITFSLNTSSQNQNISNGLVFDGEPYIAVNPNNSQHLVVAWMGYLASNLIVIKTRVSFDAGNTWSTKYNVPHTVAGYQSADPSIAFDNSGNVFLCFIDYKPFPAAGAVNVAKSTDGGLTWGTPVEVINVNSDPGQQPVDRPWMAIDNSGGPNDGNIYVTTMNPNVFGPVTPPYNPYFIKSIDGGANFEPWRYLDTTNYLAGSLIPQPMPTPCVSADGTFHAVYPSYVLSQSVFAQYFVASSTSAGSTFNYNTVLQSATAANDTLAKKGYLLISNPANANHLCLAYPNFDNGDIDIYIVESLNAGVNWGAPVRVNDDPIANNKMQDLIWADFDTDGDLVVTWRDRRNAPDSTYTTDSEIFSAIRWKDSTTFSSNFTISDVQAAHDTILEESGNDFMCVRMINDTVYAVWGDVRNTRLNIWFNRLDLASGGTFVQDLNTEEKSISVFPNPVKNKLTIDLRGNQLNNAELILMSVDGKVLDVFSNLTPITKLNLSSYSSGNYILRFDNTQQSKTIKLNKID